ncbi:hypothetical protein DYBT9275_05095 [Dyadobacter sp. CECT 9275]|uniref:BioF2-like acetyltransferase domain-containing protein n=1 Tax=Dyadobacter helix TaxID=2822344 RepID=A0A916JHT4_9BACT|nr:GNAT family N-acetyltransferase [Dyadobacter sp. CECT 9275]CAG5012068.1 hypothetical protein DYBT9275_05095 [Dyadobacter sp. CECT 9275]
MTKLYNFIKALWNIARFRYTYSIISDAGSKESFVLIGNSSGRNPYCRTYLNQRDRPNVRPVWYIGGLGIAEKLGKKYGLVVISEIAAPDNLLDKVLHVPNFVALTIDLSRGLSDYLRRVSSTTKQNIRQLEQRGFSFQISTDPSWVPSFYEQYLLPTMVMSHGDEAYISSRSTILDKLKEVGSEFVQVYLGGECVAAGLRQRRGDCYHMMNLGWRNGTAELRKKGVVTAVLWYSVRRAYELGCTMVSFGGTPPYLENGVTSFKMPWNTGICKEHTVYGYRDLLLNPALKHCYDFLKNNSIIAYGVNNCFIILSSKLPEDFHLRCEFMKGIEAWYLLRKEEDNRWDEFSHRHLPLPLRGWYEYVPMPHRHTASSGGRGE